MSTILESVNTLSEKLGVTEREQTIKDQLDLCVERLGGEGNSKDIADSAEKFAEKEDGTATFMSKTITENNTYNAADDGVSGYSSVTVNVPTPTDAFSVMILPSGYTLPDSNRCAVLVPDNNGVLKFATGMPSGESAPYAFASKPVSKTIGTMDVEVALFFTPAESFDGFYSAEENLYTQEGDTITPNDRYIYHVLISAMRGKATVTKTSSTVSNLINTNQ